MKVAINRCFGGFSLSQEACDLLTMRLNRFYEPVRPYEYSDRSMRTSPELIKVIEELGEKANSYCSKLKIVEIPDDVEWYVDSYDGIESIEEVHKSWS